MLPGLSSFWRHIINLLIIMNTTGMSHLNNKLVLEVGTSNFVLINMHGKIMIETDTHFTLPHHIYCFFWVTSIVCILTRTHSFKNCCFRPHFKKVPSPTEALSKAPNRIWVYQITKLRKQSKSWCRSLIFRSKHQMMEQVPSPKTKL
jgi:hypothetical protein